MRIVSRRASGAIDLDELERALEESDALCLQAANHETGVITDLETVGRLVRDAALPWHCDAVQAIGRLPVHFESTGAGAITTMSASGHKLGGPKGVGLLLVRGALLRPLLPGEDGDTTRRAGTPDVASAGATLAALEAAMAEVDEGLIARLQQHRDAMESGLLSRFPGAVVHGGDAERLPNTLSISLPRHDGGWPDGEELVLALAAHGVACSTGAACATGSGRPSPVLSAMGVPVEVAAASLRLSIGHPTTQEDVSHVLWAIEEVLSSDRGAL